MAAEFAKFDSRPDHSASPPDSKGKPKTESCRCRSWKKRLGSKGRQGTTWTTSSSRNERPEGSQRESGEDAKANKGKKRSSFANWTKKWLNLDCEKIHPLFECEDTSEDERDRLLAEYCASKKLKK